MNRKIKRKESNSEAVLLMKELRSYERSGTQLYLDGHPSEANEIVNACLFAENSDYMRDFISDTKEHITEIHFIKINERLKN